MFFRMILGETAVFPNAGEGLKIVDSHLVIGRVARLFSIIKNRRSSD